MLLSSQQAHQHTQRASENRIDIWRRRTFDFAAPHGRLHVLASLTMKLRQSPCKLLDVGCGPAALRQLLSRNVEYFGIDMVSEVIQAQADPAHFEVADLEIADDCFGGTRFDIVVCSGVFEYIQARDHFLRFLRRVVADNGRLILSFTNHAHYFDVVMHKRYRDPHVNFMRIRDFPRDLGTHGLHVVDRTAMTASGREPPVMRRVMTFPWCLFNRQYVFVCEPT